MKTFYLQDNIGKAKYTVNFYDGISTNKDGSPFTAIAIFHNKIKRNKYVKDLKNKGYTQTI
jgi:hypothetical protein